MNIKTMALTPEQYKEIIQTMKEGFCGARPNTRIATALMLEANLGLRISDILKLRLADIVKDGDRYRLSIVEQKTGKARVFTVPLTLYNFIRLYCIDNGIPADAIMFPVTERAVQKQLGLVCDYLDTKQTVLRKISILILKKRPRPWVSSVHLKECRRSTFP